MNLYRVGFFADCADLGVSLEGLIYFCANCWAKIPGNERASLYQLHQRRQPTESKIAKCCRLIAKKESKL